MMNPDCAAVAIITPFEGGAQSVPKIGAYWW